MTDSEHVFFIIAKVNLSAFEMMEYPSDGLTNRSHTAVDAHRIQAQTNSTVDLQNLEHRGNVPDMPESDERKLATPLCSHATSATHRHQVVAKDFPTLKA